MDKFTQAIFDVNAKIINYTISNKDLSLIQSTKEFKKLVTESKKVCKANRGIVDDLSKLLGCKI